jgi:DNA-binding protein H-NS
MRNSDLTKMEFEELWELYEELTKLLTEKVVAEKRELENRLAKLNRVETVREAGNTLQQTLTDHAPRRRYPEVLPRYCNPSDPSQKWSGRGKKPKWVVAALNSGQELEDLRIDRARKADQKQRARKRHAT